MYYLILSWRDCVDKLATDLDQSEKAECPICYKDLGSVYSVTHALNHMKRCYCLYNIENKIRTLPVSATTDEISRTISQVSTDTEIEIGNYVLNYLLDDEMID